MLNILAGFNPVLQALLGTIFTWFLTALGAACVFLAKELNRKVLDTMLGFAAGVMVAASFWSLLAPAIEMAEGMGMPPFLPAVVGFVFGGIVLRGIDKVLPHLHAGLKISEAEGMETSWQRSILLVLAITIHNIPEGMAIALPLCAGGFSKWVAFRSALVSGLAEPLGALFAALFLENIPSLVPFGLAFAGGVMVFVTLDELIPVAHESGHEHFTSLGVIIGCIATFILLGAIPLR